jgi:hypothetical protein
MTKNKITLEDVADVCFAVSFIMSIVSGFVIAATAVVDACFFDFASGIAFKIINYSMLAMLVFALNTIIARIVGSITQ